MEDLDRKICRLYEKKFSLRAIAGIMKTNGERVRAILVKNGVKIRDKREWNSRRD